MNMYRTDGIIELDSLVKRPFVTLKPLMKVNKNIQTS